MEFFGGKFGAADSTGGKKGLVGEQNVMNCMGVSINPTAALRPFTHDRTSKMLHAMDVIRMQPVSIHKVLQIHEQKKRMRRPEIHLVLQRGLRCSMSITFSFSSHNSSYMRFSTAVYARKGALSSQEPVNTSEPMSIRDSTSRIPLPLLFKRVSGVVVAKPVHKMHIGVLFVRKRHVYCYFSLHT